MPEVWTAVLIGDLLIIGNLIGLALYRQRAEKGPPVERPFVENRLAFAFFGTLGGVTTMGANAGVPR